MEFTLQLITVNFLQYLVDVSIKMSFIYLVFLKSPSHQATWVRTYSLKLFFVAANFSA